MASPLGAFIFSKTDSVYNYNTGGYDNRNINIRLDEYDDIQVSIESANPFNSPILLSDSACNKIEDIVYVAIIACQQNSFSPYYQNTPISTSFEQGDYSKVQSLCTKGVTGVPQFLNFGAIYPIQSYMADSDTGNYSFTVVIPHMQNNEQYFRATIEIYATISNSNSASVNVWIEYIGEQAIM